MKHATVITDASFCSNTRSAGWAAWVRVDDLSYPIKRSGRFKNFPKDSNEAEKFACMNGISVAKSFGATIILVQTDNLNAVNYINQFFSKQKILTLFGKDLIITAKHVKGHTNNKERRFWVNRWCDETARRHMLEQRGGRKC